MKYNRELNIILQSRVVRWSLYFLLFIVALAIFSPIIANDKPLFVNYKSQIFFPAFSGKTFADVQTSDKQKTERIYFDQLNSMQSNEVSVIMPAVPFSPHKSDLSNDGYSPPFENSSNNNTHHILGTGKRGEDVLSGLIHGTRISLTVGILSMCIAAVLGIVLGAFAGYFGDDKLKSSRGNLIMLLIGFIPAWFYGFYINWFKMTDALQHSAVEFIFMVAFAKLIFLAMLVLFYFSGNFLKSISFFGKQIVIPVDSIISRLIEVLISIPTLLIIISIAAIAKPSIINLVLIIGFISWTNIARLTRAEILKTKQLDFVLSAKSMGLSDLRIIIFHVLPNSIAPALVAITFGIATAILAESSLSFLGIGVPQDITTWGSMLASGRENFHAWWLVVFPGVAIFLTVMSFNILGEAIRDAFDPKSKSRI